MKIDKKALEFEWDEGDIEKNKKHRVEDKEAEEVFFDNNKVIFPDIIHSTEDEERLRIIGTTKVQQKKEDCCLLFLLKEVKKLELFQ